MTKISTIGKGAFRNDLELKTLYQDECENSPVKKMLSLKGDIFKDYNEENFRNLLLNNSKIVSETKINESGRKIFEFSIK